MRSTWAKIDSPAGRNPGFAFNAGMVGLSLAARVTKQAVTIPQREFLGLDEADETEIEATAGNRLGLGGDDARR